MAVKHQYTQYERLSHRARNDLGAQDAHTAFTLHGTELTRTRQQANTSESLQSRRDTNTTNPSDQSALHRRFAVESQHKLVTLWVYDLLGDVEVRQPHHRAEQRDVVLAQLEDDPLRGRPRQRGLADERPALDGSPLALALQYGRRRQVALEEGARCQVVRQTLRQVRQNRLHGVARLLARDAQVLLQGARHRGEDGLRRLVGVHRQRRTWKTGRRGCQELVDLVPEQLVM